MSTSSKTKSRLTKAVAMFASIPVFALPAMAQDKTVNLRERLNTTKVRVRERLDADLKTGVRTQADTSIRDNFAAGIRKLDIKN